VKELWPILPDTVTPRLETDKKTFEIRPRNGEAVIMDTRDVMHIPAFGYDGVRGLSPIALARENLSEQLSARKYATGVYSSGAIAAGLIKTPMRLKKEQADEIKQRWKDSIGGIENAGDIGVLDRGFEFEKMSIDPRDLQFLETRQFGVVEIARLYGVPPHLLMDVERSTSWGTGIEEQTLGFVTYTLHPGYLARMERRYTTEVLPRDLFAEFSIEGLLRTRAKDRADVYTRALSPFTGWMSRAEVRELENLPAEEEEPEPVEVPEEEPEEEPEGQPAEEPQEPDADDIPGVRGVCRMPGCGRTISVRQEFCLSHRHKPNGWYKRHGIR
jgi:HK97 family phage portal protein